MLHRDVGDPVRAVDTKHVVPSHPEPFPQRAQQQTALGNNTIRLEETTGEEEEEDDEDDEELIYSDYSDGDPAAYVEVTDADMVTLSSRKRDHEHGDRDPRVHAEAESGTLRTPPKRTRLDGSYSPLTTAEAAAARVSKRGSEEAALSGVAAGKRPRVGDGQAGGDGERTASGIGNSPTLTGESPVSLQAIGRVGVGGET